MTIDVVEGWTGPIDWQLLADRASLDLTGSTIALELFDKDGAAVSPAGSFAILDAATSTVRLLPAAADLSAAKSPYTMRTKVTDGVGKIVYFPSQKIPDTLRVHAV